MRNKKIIISSFIVLAILALVCGLIFISNRSEKVNDIFSYAVEVQDGNFSHKHYDFFTNKEDILKIVNSQRKATVKYDEYAGYTIVSEFELDGLSNKVQERCIMEESNTGEHILVSVSYWIIVTPEEKADFCTNLYNQAKNYMPKTLSDDPDSLEPIKDCTEQMNIIWQGEDNSYVYLSVPDTPDIDGDLISLQITASRDLARPYFE